MTTIGEQPLISTIYDRLLIEDDTEESVSGSDYHLAAILALYDVLLRYAQRTARRWYVTAEVVVLVNVPDRYRNPWRPMPDVYVVLDTPDTRRTSLDTRAGEAFPQFICEVASESTWGNDVTEKQRLYADLGVLEYVVFDPRSEFLGQPLRAWRRMPDGAWVSWEPDADGFLHSQVLGLRFRPENNLLRAYAPGEGLLPTGQELEQLAREEAKRRAKLEQLAREEAERRAEAERVAQQEAERRAEAERVAQEQAARLAALEDELARLRGQAHADE